MQYFLNFGFLPNCLGLASPGSDFVRQLIILFFFLYLCLIKFLNIWQGIVIQRLTASLLSSQPWETDHYEYERRYHSISEDSLLHLGQKLSVSDPSIRFA